MKERLKNLIKNPVGVSLAALHWLIFLPALAYIPVDNFSRAPESSKTGLLVIFALCVLDIPAILPVIIVLSPFYLLGITFDTFFLFVFLACFVSITFQWLLVGRVIYNFFWRTEPEIEFLRITDNTLADNLDSSNKTELK